MVISGSYLTSFLFIVFNTQRQNSRLSNCSIRLTTIKFKMKCRIFLCVLVLTIKADFQYLFAEVRALCSCATSLESHFERVDST